MKVLYNIIADKHQEDLVNIIYLTGIQNVQSSRQEVNQISDDQYTPNGLQLTVEPHEIHFN